MEENVVRFVRIVDFDLIDLTYRLQAFMHLRMSAVTNCIWLAMFSRFEAPRY